MVTREQCIDFIKTKALRSDGKINSAVLKRDFFKKTPEYRRILELTSFLSPDTSFTERWFCLTNNLSAVPVCPFSGIPLRFNQNLKSYSKTADQHKYKLRKTNFLQSSKTHKNTIAATKGNFFKKFTDKNFPVWDPAVLFEEVRRFAESRNYGKASKWVWTNDYTESADLLCNVLNYTNSELLPVVCLDDFMWNERFYLCYHKASKPPMNKDNPQQKASFQNFNVGYRNFVENETFRISSSVKSHNHWSKYVMPALESQNFVLAQEPSLLNYGKIQMKCLKCDTTFDSHLKNGKWQKIRCPGCNPEASASWIEKQVAQFLTEKGLFVERRKKGLLQSSKRKEIDIWLPDHNLGIEINGILFHSFGFSYPNNGDNIIKDKHLSKTLDIEENNHGTLLQFWDIEWLQNPELIKSMILSKLGMSPNKIYARECIKKELSVSEADEFFETTHLQGRCNAQFAFGLFYENELVAAMSFGRRKITRKKATHTELLRFSTKMYTTVVGGANRLFSMALEKVPGDIVSYANRRFSKGNLYEQLGFKFSHDSPPNYYYNLNGSLFHRAVFQKHKLKDADSSKTEKQIMMERGYRILYDCGHKVYFFERPGNK